MAKNNMSVAMPQESQDLIKNSAKKLGISTSELIRTLVLKYMCLIVHNEDETPIVLMAPNKYKGNVEGVKVWLTNKSAAIENAISPK